MFTEFWVVRSHDIFMIMGRAKEGVFILSESGSEAMAESICTLLREHLTGVEIPQLDLAELRGYRA